MTCVPGRRIVTGAVCRAAAARTARGPPAESAATGGDERYRHCQPEQCGAADHCEVRIGGPRVTGESTREYDELTGGSQDRAGESGRGGRSRSLVRASENKLGEQMGKPELRDRSSRVGDGEQAGKPYLRGGRGGGNGRRLSLGLGVRKSSRDKGTRRGNLRCEGVTWGTWGTDGKPEERGTAGRW